MCYHVIIKRTLGSLHKELSMIVLYEGVNIRCEVPLVSYEKVLMLEV